MSSRRHRPILIALRPALWAACLVLAGCASRGPAPGTPPQTLPGSTSPGAGASGAPGKTPPPTAPTVAAEQRRLADLFRGTPVVVEAPSPAQMRVVVPPPYAFDPGRSIVKPPLAKVLDHLALGLRRQTQVEVRVTASADSSAAAGTFQGAQLARERSASVRDYLIAKGVAPARLVGAPMAGTVESLEVIVSETR